MILLKVTLDIRISNRDSDFHFHFPINMTSVKFLEINDYIHPILTNKHILALSTMWENVETLELNTQAAFPIEYIQQLLTHMPVVEEIDSIAIASFVEPNEFIKCICDPKHIHLKSLRMQGQTSEQFIKLRTFLPAIRNIIPEECGSIKSPYRFSIEGSFIRKENPFVDKH